MADTLQAVKERLKKQYLGKSGVHALGVSRAQNAIQVYLDADAGDQEATLRDLEQAAAPFKVIVVREGRSQIG